MVAAALKLVGFDLQRQLARLKVQAEQFKDRATDEIKQKALDASLTIALAFIGLLFAMLTIVAGLVALYLWVAMTHGPFVALGAVALTTAVMAAVLFAIAANRGKSKPLPLPRAAPLEGAQAPLNQGFGVAGAPLSSASFVDAVTQDLTDRTARAANEALDSAAEIVRKSPPEAVLATLAVAVVAGVLIGRRR